MKVTTTLAAIVGLVSATAINVNKRASPISVSLKSISNTEVEATITNTGSAAYNLLTKGTILDEAPIEKLQVFAGADKVAFEGIQQRLSYANLEQDVFTLIGAGETVTVTVDMASLHDLSAGGLYSVVATGSIPYAEAGSTELTGTATYSTESLSVAVDGAAAAKVPRAVDVMLGKRTVLSSDCTGSKLTAIRSALSNCVSIANAAATAATSGSSTKFSEYFKTTSSTTRSAVAARFRAVASDCGSTTSGATTTHCTDGYGACSSNVLAYTVPSANYISYCNLFFTALPGVTSTCHAQDQATTVIHEETHAPGVYSPGTSDLGYGYSNAVALSATNAVRNADTFALYANAIRVGC